MSVELNISCSLCAQSHKQQVKLPDGWLVRYNGIDEEDGFCPDHAIIAEFADSQCPGCVGGWRDCPLWTAFAYREKNLTEADFASLNQGICPKRVNGTMSVNLSGSPRFESVNLSEQAPLAAGQALSQAIKDYWARYSI